jgi:alpha-galactosidase
MTVALRDQLGGLDVEGWHRYLDEGPGWQVESAGQVLSWDHGSPPLTNGTQTRWSVAHPSGLEADVALERDITFNAATIQVTLRNTADQPSIPISALKPLRLGLPTLAREDTWVRSVGGGLTTAFYPPLAYRENTVVFREGGSQRFRIESGADGRSSNRDLPFLQLAITGAPPVGLIVALEWSGQWFQEIGPAGHDGSFIWEAGIPVRNLTLGPGETLPLPPAHLIGFSGDLDAGANACRRYIYERIGPLLSGRRPLPPLSYDHWFGIGCNFDEDLLRRLVNRAAELGLEYFVLDAGWFAGCGPGYDFSSGVGNWERVDAAKFPQGLEPLADYVRAKGLHFGLWFEVERAHRDSDLVRQHPDWFFDIGAPYLHLNLAHSPAQDYVIEVIGRWIRQLGLAWSRWDYNIAPKPFWDAADPTGKIQFAYMAGLYRVLDTLMREHPRWLVECCASGGRRIDLGTLRRAHTIWFSDHTEDALVCRFMQIGAQRFLPGNLPNSAIPVGRDTLGRASGSASPDEATVLSRMCGALSFDGAITMWSPVVMARVARLVQLYRTFRHLLVADFYPLTPHPQRPNEGEVVEFVSRDGAEAVILGFAGALPATEVVVRPRGLNCTATYLVSNPLLDDERRYSGEALAEHGLTLSLLSGAAIYRLQEIERTQP